MPSGPKTQTVTTDCKAQSSEKDRPRESHGTALPIGNTKTLATVEKESKRRTPAYSEQKLESIVCATAPGFSPDGHLVAAGHPGRAEDSDYNDHVSLWKIATGERQILEESFGSCYSCVFSHDSTLIALAGGKLGLWDVQTRCPKWLVEGVSYTIFSFAFSPDGKIIAGVGDTGRIRIWDVATGGLKRLIHCESERSFQNVAFSSNGKLLAWPSPSSETVYVWDVATESYKWLLEGPSGKSIAFSPDCQLLASGSHGDTTVRLWSLSTGRILRQIEYDGRGCLGIRYIAFSPNGSLMACSGLTEDHPIQLWDVATGEEQQLRKHEGDIRGLAFLSDSQLIAFSSDGVYDVRIRQWNIFYLTS